MRTSSILREPQKQTPPICTVSTCSRLAEIRGWCKRHWLIQYRHGGDPEWTPTCEYPDCAVRKPEIQKGSHWYCCPEHMPVCKADECNKLAVAHGCCNTHYRRNPRYNDPFGNPTCAQEECETRVTRASGQRYCQEHREPCIVCGSLTIKVRNPPLCATHYAYKLKRGSIDAPRLKRPHNPDATERECLHCKITKPLNEFNVSQKSIIAGVIRASICKDCDSIRRKKAYAELIATPEGRAHLRQQAKEWAKRNPERYKINNREAQLRRRARAAQAPVYFVTMKDRQRLSASACFACGSTTKLHLDHIIPIARGGYHGVGNFRMMCESCNLSKNDLTYSAWKYSGRPRAVEVFGIQPRWLLKNSS
jgi:hypothetical protein